MAARRAGIQRRPVHGVVLLDKPLGFSSNQALQKVKWLLRAEKGGHTGTLDPLATGVLPLLFGAATKFASHHLAADKTYRATLQLGVRTSTGDREGDVVETRPVPGVDRAQLDEIARRFTGAIEQLPPMYSALKKDGKALYEYARAGIEVERAPRRVEIFSLVLEPVAGDAGATLLEMHVHCSKGTYVRTLAEDVGAALGCGAHLTALRREATAGFALADCTTLPALEGMADGDRLACLRAPQILLGDAPRIVLEGDDAGRFLCGQRRRGDWPDAEQVAVYGREPSAFLGSARVKAAELIPRRLLSPPEIEQLLDRAGQVHGVSAPAGVFSLH